MRVAVFIFITLVAFVACKKEDRLQVPPSEIALAWIPQDNDSVQFKPEATRGITVLRQGTLQKKWNTAGGSTETALITQNIKSYTGNFSLAFSLESEAPQNLPTGGFARREDLTITNVLGQEFLISFFRDTITTNLFIVDSLEVNNLLYTSVLTDNETFYYTRDFRVIRYLDNNIWHNLIR